jgi:serine/threonine protein kinase
MRPPEQGGFVGMVASKSSLVGSLIEGRYLIDDELGGGGISVVYTARDLKGFGRKVVVKILLEESRRNEYIVKKFRQEAEALYRVEHPHVVNVLSYGELADGQPYLILQYIEGVSLRAAIQPGGIELERCARIVRQTASALTAAHEKGILHRDLKPDNIMLQSVGDGEEQVKVIDFGIAKVKDSVIAQETVVVATAGTIAYMSPEQLSAKELTPASDVYALGIIAYELLTGNKPFNPESPFQLLETQRAGVTQLPTALRPDLPAAAEAIILKALAYEPQDRYQRAKEFGDRFYHALTGVPAKATGHLDAGVLSKTIPDETLNPTMRLVTDASIISYQTTAQELPQQTAPVNEEPATTQTTQEVSGAGRRWGVKLWLPLLAAVLAIGVAAVFVGRKMLRPKVDVEAVAEDTIRHPQPEPSAPQSAKPEAVLTYWLIVQEMHDGRKIGEAFQTSGLGEILRNGWQVDFHAESAKDGFLYVINDAKDDKGEKVFTVAFPSKYVNSDLSSQVRAAQDLKMEMELSGHPDTETFWFIWSSQQIPELEDIGKFASQFSVPEIRDEAKVNSLNGILSKYDPAKASAEENTQEKKMNVKGTGDPIIYKAALTHH